MAKTKVVPQSQRQFHIRQHDLNLASRFTSNYIKTAKYGVLDFLPKTIFLQFKRYANIYFLLIAILQSISAISPLNPFTAIAPFVFVVTLSILREFLEDLTRHRSDREANARKCTVLEETGEVEMEWKKLRVGDIVLIKDSDFFPTDLLVIGSSNPNGLCFIETSSLDGEKNLKPRTAPKETLELYQPKECKVNLKGTIECIHPNAMLSSFDGTLVLEEEKKVILNAKQLLYRGAKLRNTAWIVGVAVYTGSDTKLMKNSESAKIKQSKIERLTNKLILFILGFQILVCIGAAIGTFVFNYNYVSGHTYIQGYYTSGLEAFVSFWSYFLLNNTMIPISLIVSLEFVKLAQAYFIEKDDELFNRKKNRRATVFTSAINEELGQVEYLFTDKTGTLTCNEMEFKIAVIGNEMYGEASDEAKAANSVCQNQATGRDTLLHQPDQGIVNHPEEGTKKENINFSFADERLAGLLKDKRGDQPAKLTLFTADNSKKTLEFNNQSELAREYFTALATCHECLVETASDGSLSYQGPSPDEVTLVDAANRMGFSYVGGSENNKKITIFGQEKEFQMLHSFEFNSDRKRMSVILKDSSGQIKLYIKGADSIIKARLKHSDQQPYLKYIDQKLDVFARKGLRTLLIGMKVLDPTEYSAFYQKYMALADSNEKEKEIDKLADEIERDLYLIGATAVEDRLQDNVPQTIYDLIQANIKVWMLTGDKMETAENIAKSCNLVQDDFQLMRCSEKSKAELEDVLLKHRKDHDYFLQNGIRKALIVEGESLAVILNDQTLTTLFVSITKTCEAVVCCRVTPKQKADVVRLIKKNLKKITLSIGDGANDVNMIQEAHIGVGIYGQEGMRAVQASDFALPEFQGLWRLLFIHGRWSYIRIAEMILYFFYKNMVFTIPQFYFAFICAFSAQSVFDDFYITTYNLVFTSIPLLIRATIDQDVNYKEFAPANPDGVETRPLIKKYFTKLYYMGQKNKLFGERKFIKSVLQGLLHGVFLFLVTHFTLYKTILDSDGKSVDLYYFSITLYTSIILLVDMKVAVYTKYWTILTPITLVGLSLVLYFAYMWIINSYGSTAIGQTAAMLFTSMHFYLIIFLNVGVVFLLDIGYRFIKIRYYSELSDIFQHLIKSKMHNVLVNFTRLFRNDEEKREFNSGVDSGVGQIRVDEYAKAGESSSTTQFKVIKADADSEIKSLVPSHLSLIADDPDHGFGERRRSDIKRITKPVTISPVKKEVKMPVKGY